MKGQGAFNKELLGQEEPGFMDYVLNQRRFSRAMDLRNSIVGKALEIGLSQAQEPTLGEARAIFGKNFPAPPNAVIPAVPGTGSIGNWPIEGQDEYVGTQQVRVPLHGPGAPIPIGQQSVEAYGPGAPMQVSLPPDESKRRLNARTTYMNRMVKAPGVPMQEQRDANVLEAFSLYPTSTTVEGPRPTVTQDIFAEGPRPTGTREVGVYAPATVPMEDRGLPASENLNARLPRSFQDYVKALDHRAGLREYAGAGRQPSAEYEKYQNMRNAAIAQWQAEHPGQVMTPADIYGIEEKIQKIHYSPEDRPGTPGDKFNRARARREETQADFEQENQETSLEEKRARTKEIQARTKEIEETLDLKIQALRSKIQLDKIQGSASVQKGNLAQLANDMKLSNTLLNYMKFLTADDSIEESTKVNLIRAAFEKVAPFLDVTQGEGSFLGNLFGADRGINIVPKVPPPPGPTLTPPPGAGPGSAPPPNPGVESEQAAAFKAYQEMKDGETRMVNGRMMIKRGKRLDPVK